jgi:hypothetical protein
VYQLILKIFDYTNHFPREYKFTLGQDLKRDGINLLRSIYRANKSKEKTPYLVGFILCLKRVKILDIKILF